MKYLKKSIFVYVCTMATAALTACSSIGNSSSSTKEADYSGQQIEFEGYYFNIPSDFVNIPDDTVSDEGIVSSNYIKGDASEFIAFMSQPTAYVEENYFKTEAKSAVEAFVDGISGTNAKYYETNIGGNWAQGAKYTAPSIIDNKESVRYQTVNFYSEETKKTIMIVGIENDGSNTFDNAMATCRKTSESSSTSSAAGSLSDANKYKLADNDEEKPLEIDDTWCAISSSMGGSTFVDFAAIVRNPNNELIAEYATLTATAKAADGTILGTSDELVLTVMPGDKIVMSGMISMSELQNTEGVTVHYDIDCKSYSKVNSYNGERSSCFTASNISEQGTYITGEVANNSANDHDLVKVCLILKKNGEIVYVESQYLDIGSGQKKAFQFERYSGFPEHDSVEIKAFA